MTSSDPNANHPNDGSLLDIDPARVRPNPSNPRRIFPTEQLSKLAASIDSRGMLVPVSVYIDDETSPGEEVGYVLIDGERRWRCAQELGMESIPAILVNPRPDDLENLLTMFHIHMVREDWQNMPTAYAIKEISDRTGIIDPKGLSQQTGLAPEMIQRLQLAVSLPDRYRDLIMDNKIPLNFFWELERNVIQPLQRKRPVLFNALGIEFIRDQFVEKRLAGFVKDVIDLRNMSRVISVAVQDAGAPENGSDLDEAIAELVRNRERTIQETYDDTVGIAIEAGKFAQQCQSLVTRLDFLLKKADEEDELKILLTATRQLAKALELRLSEATAPSPPSKA